MGTSYHQFCPVAKAMELLDERWTLLLVRELLTGSDRFNQLRRGLPRMSPTLLSRRLHELERAGVLTRQADGTEVRYLLTPAGQELRPVVEALGVWGVRWVPEVGDADLDPKLLLWDMHRHVDPDVCDVDPGFDVTVRVTASLRRLVDVWRGEVPWSDALRSGGLEVDGPEALRRAVPRWFTLSPFAGVPRPERLSREDALDAAPEDALEGVSPSA